MLIFRRSTRLASRDRLFFGLRLMSSQDLLEQQLLFEMIQLGTRALKLERLIFIFQIHQLKDLALFKTIVNQLRDLLVQFPILFPQLLVDGRLPLCILLQMLVVLFDETHWDGRGSGFGQPGELVDRNLLQPIQHNYNNRNINIMNMDMDMDMEEEKPTITVRRTIPNILVTGTPGTGKTTLATLLNDTLKFTYINIGALVGEQKLWKEWDDEFNVPVFDEDMVLDYIQQTYDIAKGGLIIDFHSSDFFPLRYFDLVVLMRCSNDKLYPRLEARGYNEKKISENIDCEIMEVTHDEVYAAYPPEIILQLYNQEEQDMQKNINTVVEWLIDFKAKREQEQPHTESEMMDS